ncbi:hypothetical protein CONCODRAFT_10175 [Conidiobolus coronatus NRRL 28638]|uniref:RNI-like protein n=1 Tax=Conidiobolus coronatus (strain ATCC 28846 / CBS 209.66 / NRRL 28638) TaxID=796925 RepID=A0A137NXX6_CONC2|nr:hypothetical protein CONCODRAFT_10175 [Conidiobolus coronatus NRRL 28638]|eukprot:KXN67723.1 hypothetical protein CONCODRAFT_10175 [Conidiobolus coronatus NRRL 28638]
MNNENAIDWNLILINVQIHLYLPKSDLANLSLTSKLIGKKLFPMLYKSTKISENILLNQPSYFMNNQILEFRDIDSLSYLRLIGKNWFNKEAAFKEAHIDPFIKELKSQVKLRAIRSESLSFDHLLKACYYLLPITLEFLNLRNLSLNYCIVSLKQLNNVMEKLTKLEVLDLKNIYIIKSSDCSSINNINLPQSLCSLTYSNVNSWLTNIPLKKPHHFLSTTCMVYDNLIRLFSPVHISSLRKFCYISNIGSEEYIAFLRFNNQIEDLSLPITLISAIKTNSELLTNLKKLRLYAQNFNYEQIAPDNLNIPNFPNLEELNLNLRTNTEMKFAELLIKKCPKLRKLNITSIEFEIQKLRELVKFAKNLKYFNGEVLF